MGDYENGNRKNKIAPGIARSAILLSLSLSLSLNNKLPLSTVAIDAFVLVSNLDLKGEN